MFSGGFLCGFHFRVVKIKVWGYELKIRFNHPLDRIFILSQTTSFRLFKLKEFAGNSFELDENGRKFSKWIENTGGKGEITLNEQFQHFPTVFSKELYTRHLKRKQLVWERVNSRPHNKFLDITKFKAKADDKCFLKADFLFIYRVENLGFSFPTIFVKPFSFWVVKSGICWGKKKFC